MNHEKDQEFHEAAREALDDKESQLTPEVKRALYQARMDALQKRNQDKDSTRLWSWSLQKSLYPTGLAMAAILTMVLWLPDTGSEIVPDSTSTQFSAETLDMLSAEEDLSFYEDLEFINWLATQPEQG